MVVVQHDNLPDHLGKVNTHTRSRNMENTQTEFEFIVNMIDMSLA